MQRFYLIFLFLSCALFLRAQDVVPGELLVQFKAGADLRVFMEEMAFEEDSRLRLERRLIPSLNIWQLRFAAQKVDANKLLELVRLHPAVEIAQFNHYVQQRSTIPNDSDFGIQWHHVNTGQSGGSVDMDMNSDLAWDLTTGGLSQLQDTIVVAVIDDGCQLNHPDIQANLWRNYAEIPNNGIDDDNNGYVDDYLGWNSNSNDDDVGANGAGAHGTPVAGIVGAEGNNGIGVSGVNWAVKLMIIRNNFNTTEANVLVAYGYALEARRRYNQSNGQSGAFVVASNASWGIDNGQPSSAPLWCAFYDSLGAEGILNVAATTNNNTNVDVNGDLPTTCPSDYLLSVNSINRFGTRSGGYGTTHIDLGAPGSGVYSTGNNSSYATFGGTSAAAPQVAGAIALAYAGACANFMIQSRIHPEQAALAVRQAIISGTSPTGSLQGITLSGGRLNLFGMLQNLPCANSLCFSPYNVNITAMDSSLALNWQAQGDSVRLFWRVAGLTNWQDSVTLMGNQYTITGLSTCSVYELGLMTFCDSLVSELDSFTVQTEACCELADDFVLQSRDSSSTLLSWSSQYPGAAFWLRWRVWGASQWDSVFVNVDSFQLNNLLPCNIYEAQLQTICVDTLTAFSTSLVWVTEGCSACSANYCSMTGTNSSLDWMERVEIGDFIRVTGNNNGYYQEDSSFIELQAGALVSFTVDQGNSFLEILRIWCDLNGDEDFEDAGELLYSGLMNFETSLSDVFLIPANASPGSSRLRLALQWATPPTLCNNIPNGEVEDYCVQILPFTNLNTIENQSTSDLQIIPNPNQGTFSLSRKLPEGSLWSLYDSQGRFIQRGVLHASEISIPNLRQGLYFFQIEGAEGIEVLKFLLQE